MTARNCSSYPNPKRATAGEGRRYWSGRPKASKGKPRAQSTWWPMRCFFELTLVSPWVTHMSASIDHLSRR